MKKIISILLLVTMLLTTLVIAMPASAAEAGKLSDALLDTGSTATTPTGNYRGKGCNNALYAAGGERANWTAISTEEQFLAITSGTADTTKPFLPKVAVKSFRLAAVPAPQNHAQFA